MVSASPPVLWKRKRKRKRHRTICAFFYARAPCKNFPPFCGTKQNSDFASKNAVCADTRRPNKPAHVVLRPILGLEGTPSGPPSPDAVFLCTAAFCESAVMRVFCPDLREVALREMCVGKFEKTPITPLFRLNKTRVRDPSLI